MKFVLAPTGAFRDGACLPSVSRATTNFPGTRSTSACSKLPRAWPHCCSVSSPSFEDSLTLSYLERARCAIALRSRDYIRIKDAPV